MKIHKTRFIVFFYCVFCFLSCQNDVNKTEINVESLEFNKKFFFKYSGSKETISPVATRCLSPVVQTMLVDLEKSYIEVIDDNTLLLDGRVDIEELNEYLKNPLVESDNYETVSGLILYYLNRLPVKGEKLELEDMNFVIESIIDNRIRKIKLISDEAIKFEED